MRKSLTVLLSVLIALAIAAPVWAQGSGPGPQVTATGQQSGPGEPQEATPRGPGVPPEETPVGPGEPAESVPPGQVGPRVETPERERYGAGEPAQTRTQEQSGDLTRTHDRDQDGSGEALEEPLVTRTRTRLQICEDCVPQDLGLMHQFRSWMRLHVPALVQMRLLGVVPFSMSGTAVVDGDTLIFALENGNRWTEALMGADPAPTLVTTDAVIKAVYPDGSATAEIIDWTTLGTILDDCPDSGVMIFGYVNEEGDLVATRIQVRVLCSST
jgi:hypothetical protein